MNWYRAIIYGVAVVGEGVTAARVLPSMWESNPLDAIIVGTALLLVSIMFATKGLTGRVWLQ